MSEKRFLIVVDMQNDFIDAALGTAEAQAILPAAVARIRAAREAGETVIATLDTHHENYLETSEGRKLPVCHCIRGTAGWRLNPEIEAALGDAMRLEKPTFGSVRLPGIVRELAGESGNIAIELIGLCTDIAWFPTRCCSRPASPKPPSPSTAPAAPESPRKSMKPRWKPCAAARLT